MNQSSDRDRIFGLIRAVGSAALTVDLENSHSGNIAMRCEDKKGGQALAITATGAQKGELTPDKICYPSLTTTNYGHYKASTETDIHARILQIPGVNASMHGHTKTATVVTLDDDPMPKKNPRAPLKPVDELGVRYLDTVPVDWFAVASGSKEMTDTIHERLTAHPACMVQAHGAFARGRSLEEAFFNLCVTEHSGEVIFFLKLLGADLGKARELAEKHRPWIEGSLADFSIGDDRRRDFADEADTEEMLLTQGFRIFESRYSPFHTGSMSLRASGSLLYAAKASMPHDLAGPMIEAPMEVDAGPDPSHGGAVSELDMHRIIYRETPLKAVVHCHVSSAQAAAMAAMQSDPDAPPKVIPIDAEGGFLYPSVPVLPPRPDPEALCRALLDYRMAIVTLGGVWSAGEQSVGEALRHVSSIKDVCFYRIMSRLMGLDLSMMEPDRARSW